MEQFRTYHLLNLLNEYETQSLPLDRYLSDYFRANKAIGSKDRGFIAEGVYGIVRWKGLLDHLCEAPITWAKRWEKFQEFDSEKYQEDLEIPQNTRLSFPETLFNLIAASHGIERAKELCLICNTQAPTTVRANSLRTTRDELLARWNIEYQVAPCEFSTCGITFLKKINLFGLPEFKEGFFEVQDEGSQLLAGLMKVKKGQQIMDYCSGSGGKTLAFAPQMAGTGQIFLHDIRLSVLLEAKKRLKRAGIQNAQIVKAEDPKLSRLKKKMDWVLVDVPCSGTGTLRRNPDMKWKFDPAALERLQGQQRNIFEKALSYMHPDGRIVYGTCSILKEENQDQLAHFIKTYNLEVEGDVFQTFPTVGGMDGFFGVVLKKVQ